MNYLISKTAPNTQLVVSGPISQWHTTNETLAASGTYLITASTTGQVAISDNTIGTVDATTGITLAAGIPFYVYIESGQKIKFSATTGTYVLLSVQ